ncbi:hypothetical protein APY09_00550 [Schaalia odontolytica]|uniref:Uncharacterized protein n=1 Tax=Schaalia odontolytica TaxID=1660 RepID=A0A0V8RXT4_9ACTO|nr:hypothetical protein APY09_00550 [Schaalia odontolytica]
MKNMFAALPVFVALNLFEAIMLLSLLFLFGLLLRLRSFFFPDGVVVAPLLPSRECEAGRRDG